MTITDAGLTQRLENLLAQLTLEEKVQLLTGQNFWNTWPIAKIGLRRIVFSDGPSGVRGEIWDERSPSLNLPSATAMSSAWDVDIARRYGAAVAIEARRKGVDVVLGPTINLHRSPLGGRHFEAFSEDPVLTSELAAAFVTGVQDNGVGATLKHYIANDFETDRFTVDVVVGDRTLRELYLLAFEKSVTEAGAWLVMSSYNSINGVTATEHDLLETPLSSEWGFDGVVISDWTAVRSIQSANASQDLAMPGPPGPWGDALVAAVQSGEVPVAAIDRKVRRILLLAARVGALEAFEPAVDEPAFVEDGIAFTREAAAAGMVLLRNQGELPWAPEAPASLAIIGHQAAYARTQGGGSATVLPERVVSPLGALRSALPETAITYSVGAVVAEGIIPFPVETITVPTTGDPGLLVRFLAKDGSELFAENRLASSLVWFGGDAPIISSALVEVTTRYVPDETGTVNLAFASVGDVKVFVDDVKVIDATLVAVGNDLGAAFLSPPAASAEIAVTRGTAIDIRVEYNLEGRSGDLANALSFTLGLEPTHDDPESLIAAAVAIAKAADVALVVVGTNATVESEGFDRTSLALPGHQDALVAAVAAANPRTVVIVNAGSPVLMPWRDDVAAVLVGYFGGQEFGDAVADVLLGLVEPGGRLPTTWPKTEADVPVLNVTPDDHGQVSYDEGVFIGYRAWLKAGTEPAYPFGFGLGYTTFTVSDFTVPGTAFGGEVIEASATLANTGARTGKAVLEVFAERKGSSIERPERWLVGFVPAVVEAGSSTTVSLEIPTRLLAHWADGWEYEPGEFVFRAGFSVVDLPCSAALVLDAPVVEGTAE
jgi:beta-glucosidase